MQRYCTLHLARRPLDLLRRKSQDIYIYIYIHIYAYGMIRWQKRNRKKAVCSSFRLCYGCAAPDRQGSKEEFLGGICDPDQSFKDVA